jgi:hypothetical protein
MFAGFSGITPNAWPLNAATAKPLKSTVNVGFVAI